MGRGETGRVKDLGVLTATEHLCDRDLNVGLSGGEMKRSEMLQLLAMEPEVALFDEPESGVDLDNIAVGRDAKYLAIPLGHEIVAIVVHPDSVDDTGAKAGDPPQPPVFEVDRFQNSVTRVPYEEFVAVQMQTVGPADLSATVPFLYLTILEPVDPALGV